MIVVVVCVRYAGLIDLAGLFVYRFFSLLIELFIVVCVAWVLVFRVLWGCRLQFCDFSFLGCVILFGIGSGLGDILCFWVGFPHIGGFPGCFSLTTFC